MKIGILIILLIASQASVITWMYGWIVPTIILWMEYFIICWITADLNSTLEDFRTKAKSK